MRIRSLLAALVIAALSFSASACNRSSGAPSNAAEGGVNSAINAQSPGGEIDLAKYVVSGKLTVFDFYSKYCGPCVKLSPLLDKLAEKDPKVAVKKVDINRPDVEGIDWDSPVVKQYGLHGVPHFVIFDASGKKIAEGRPAYEQVMQMLQKAGVLEG